MTDALSVIEARVAKLEDVLGTAPIATCEERFVSAMLRYAASLSGLPLSEVRTRRTARASRVRFAVIYAARTTLNYSLSRIARAMSLDHTSVMNGMRRANQLRETDPVFRQLSDRLVATFQRILSDPDIQEVTTA